MTLPLAALQIASIYQMFLPRLSVGEFMVNFKQSRSSTNGRISTLMEQEMGLFEKLLFGKRASKNGVFSKFYHILLIVYTVFFQYYILSGQETLNLSPLFETQLITGLFVCFLQLSSVILFILLDHTQVNFEKLNELWQKMNFKDNSYYVGNLTERIKTSQRLFLTVKLLALLISFYILAPIFYHQRFHKVDFVILSGIFFTGYLSWVLTERYRMLVSTAIMCKLLFETILIEINIISSLSWNVELLKTFRSEYFAAIEFTSMSSDVWKFFLLFNYPLIPTSAVLALYMFINQSSHPASIVLVIAISLLLLAIYHMMNYHIIGINIQAASLYDAVFRTTFLAKSPNYLVEVSKSLLLSQN